MHPFTTSLFSDEGVPDIFTDLVPVDMNQNVESQSFWEIEFETFKLRNDVVFRFGKWSELQSAESQRHRIIDSQRVLCTLPSGVDENGYDFFCRQFQIILPHDAMFFTLYNPHHIFSVEIR